MCGIAGFADFGDSLTYKERLLFSNHYSCRTALALKKRGPDGKGIFIEPDRRFCLIHTLLAITDQSPTATQPMFSQNNRFVISFNGEIYNTDALRLKFLANIKLKTETDTEVILELFAQYQETVFSELEGIFAIAIWDRQTGVLWLAKDHLSIKPLYFYYNQNRRFLAFASETKILAREFELWEVDEQSRAAFLTYGCTLSPKTIFKEIKSLLPGHYLKFSEDKFVILPFAADWFINTNSSVNYIYDKINLNNFSLKKVLCDVIASQVPNKVSWGLFLSAGIDSNLLAAILKELGHKFHTFTIGFETKSGSIISEAVAAKKLAAYWGTDHHEWVVKDSEVKALFEEYLHALDQPSMDGFNSFLAAKLAAPFCKVVFSGVGADELFQGYWHFAHLNNWHKISQKYWKNILYKITSSIKALPFVKSLLFRIKHFFLQDETLKDNALAAYLFYRRENILPQFICELSQEFGLDQIFSKKYLNFWQKQALAELFFYDQNKLLRDIDNLSMYHGLEVRVPFLDRRIISKALLLSRDINNETFMNFFGKKLLRSILEEYNPPHIFQQKQGFELPMAAWSIEDRDRYKQVLNAVLNS